MIPTPPARVPRSHCVKGKNTESGPAAPAEVFPDDPSLLNTGNGDSSSSADKAELVVLKTARNAFGITRRYLLPHTDIPTRDPDQIVPLREDCNEPGGSREKEDGTDDHQPQRPVSVFNGGSSAMSYGPFSSRTAFLLAEWYWQSSRKSFLDFQKLVSVFKDPEFALDDAINVNWKAAFKALGANKTDLPDEQGSWISDEGWITELVSIDIPFHNRMKEPGVKPYEVGGFRYRSIVSVIKERLSKQEDSCAFHYYPYEATWRRTSDSPEVRLYGELYASQAFREAHEALQKQPRSLRDAGLERVVVALMIWSDSTQLTSFGGASLWPCYLFFGNESKYRRGEPSRSLGRQIAYFIKLPDRLSDFLTEKNGGKLPTSALFKYCARALFHKQWSILLSAEFIDAMKYGIVHTCLDGKKRCFFPRILTYSCDYPENRDLITIMFMQGFSRNVQTWAPVDEERIVKKRSWTEQMAKISVAQSIIQEGYAVANKSKIGHLLDPESLFPVQPACICLQTAFAERLPEMNPDILSALAVDILHEFEIGVWKKLYIHLIRLLDAFTKVEHMDGMTLSAELDSRYRNTPAFGRDTIRRFPLNVTEMKRKAARDYEDLLQCAIPAFESLLPEPYNTSLMILLFVCAQWHALAKLRLHTDHTLGLLDFTTSHLGAKLRAFHSTTAKVPTKELQKEADARARRAGREGNGKSEGVGSRRPVALSIFTIKFHFLGDYTSVIRQFGTTDSYSTQTGELYHRVPKSWYPRTDKKDYERQLTQIERRQARLANIRANLESNAAGTDDPTLPHQSAKNEPQGRELLESRYTIGMNRNCPITLDALIDRSHWGPRDPYIVGFIPNLKWHLFPRLLEDLGYPVRNAIPGDQWVHVTFKDDRIFSHKMLRMNFTTYDVRRAQDVIHIETPQCNVMLLNNRYNSGTRSVEHPYLYGKVLGVFHADVSYVGYLPGGNSPTPAYRRIDFVWVNWYNFIESKTEFSLDRLASFPANWEGGLAFIDPSDIIRGVHLIPQFSLGRSPYPRVKSKLVAGKQEAWNVYFINRFADRDLFMRYQYGMSVGHWYMQDLAFPPAHIPIIPSGFDHCLFELGSNSSPPSEGAGNDDSHLLIPPVITPTGMDLTEPQPSSQDTGSGIAAHPDTLPLNARQKGKGRASNEDREDGTRNDEEREDQEEDDMDDDADEEPREDDEREDHFDRMDDEELVHHDEMYGLSSCPFDELHFWTYISFPTVTSGHTDTEANARLWRLSRYPFRLRADGSNPPPFSSAQDWKLSLTSLERLPSPTNDVKPDFKPYGSYKTQLKAANYDIVSLRESWVNGCIRRREDCRAPYNRNRDVTVVTNWSSSPAPEPDLQVAPCLDILLRLGSERLQTYTCCTRLQRTTQPEAQNKMAEGQEPRLEPGTGEPMAVEKSCHCRSGSCPSGRSVVGRRDNEPRPNQNIHLLGIPGQFKSYVNLSILGSSDSLSIKCRVFQQVRDGNAVYVTAGHRTMFIVVTRDVVRRLCVSSVFIVAFWFFWGRCAAYLHA
ncbi:hypothetical protein NMY22_g803 [Coprinellus aureogranulatus]|nr:hypothetical protein NMY22_g803 [Coprinellus aureogranulatus]